jgi:feruloyl esterase
MPWAIEAARQQTENPLTLRSLELLDANSKKSCDLLDGVEDGVINDPRLCSLERLNLGLLSCKNGPSDDCLTAAQIKTAEHLYRGLFDSQGNLVSPGVMPGAESAGDWAMWMFPNDLIGDGVVSLNSSLSSLLAILMRRLSSFDIDDFDPANDHSVLEEINFMDVVTADLNEFKARGGKILMYQGWNDFPLRPERAIDYLAQVEDAHGGAKEADDFFRMFMVPGMIHCATGPGAWMADYVDPIVAWTEEGVAPERITAVTAPGPQSFSRPLCVYPRLAQYKGKGDKDKADSYRCSVK